MESNIVWKTVGQRTNKTGIFNGLLCFIVAVLTIICRSKTLAAEAVPIDKTFVYQTTIPPMVVNAGQPTQVSTLPPTSPITSPVLIVPSPAVSGTGSGSNANIVPSSGSPVLPQYGGAKVVTQFGVFEGVLNSNIFSYKGIPFAKPPVGDLRWKAPLDPAYNPKVVKADQFPNACPQIADNAFLGNEDCLYLNLWAPKGYNRKKSVMVYMHGGGNTQGSSGQQHLGATLFDGQKLAERNNAVVVTIQYRLGVLGYLVADSLAGSSKKSGNYGLLDQQQALKWVKNNISKFGGDPSRVLLFGESGGAVDTCLQVASPLAKGLFSAAAIQSGACIASTLADAKEKGDLYISGIGCRVGGAVDEASCLRAKDAKTLVESAFTGSPLEGGVVSMDWQPTIDGTGGVLPDDPLLLISRGQHNHVPVIVGSNTDEMSIQVPANVTAQMVQAQALFFYPYTQELLKLYPPTDPRESYVGMNTDGQFTCNARRIARALVEGQSQNVYQYVFSQALPTMKKYGAWHGAELFYLFQTIEDSALKQYVGAGDAVVEELMRTLWFKLVNSAGNIGSSWTRFDKTNESYLLINEASTMGTHFRKEKCDLWDKILTTK